MPDSQTVSVAVAKLYDTYAKEYKIKVLIFNSLSQDIVLWKE